MKRTFINVVYSFPLSTFCCVYFTFILFSCTEPITEDQEKPIANIPPLVSIPNTKDTIALDSTREPTTLDLSVTLRLIYKQFEVRISGFAISMERIDNSSDTFEFVNLNGKVSSNRPSALLVKTDTLHLHETSDGYDARKIFQIITKHATDRFRVSYAYMQMSYETIDELSATLTPTERQYYPRPFLFELTPYIFVSDSSGYFNLPKTFSESKSNNYLKEYKQAFKRKYQLTDTSLMISPWKGGYGSVEIYIPFTREKKLFQYFVSEDLYIRIDWIVRGKIKETKYIIVIQEKEGF